MDLRELIIEEGEEVYCLCWDSGGPGAGADCERIYLYDGNYYPILSYDDETEAYATLAQALVSKELSSLMRGTTVITFPAEYADTVFASLRNVDEEEIRVSINGQDWLAKPGEGVTRIS
jgi:hypothetical protein